MASDEEEDAGGASRPRWSGNVEDLAKALDMRQPGDVKYDEDTKNESQHKSDRPEHAALAQGAVAPLPLPAGQSP